MFSLTCALFMLSMRNLRICKWVGMSILITMQSSISYFIARNYKNSINSSFYHIAEKTARSYQTELHIFLKLFFNQKMIKCNGNIINFKTNFPFSIALRYNYLNELKLYLLFPWMTSCVTFFFPPPPPPKTNYKLLYRFAYTTK